MKEIGVVEEAGVFKPAQMGTDGGGTAMPKPDLRKTKERKAQRLVAAHIYRMSS